LWNSTSGSSSRSTHLQGKKSNTGLRLKQPGFQPLHWSSSPRPLLRRIAGRRNLPADASSCFHQVVTYPPASRDLENGF
jgi:hypothetical protein